MWLLEKHLQHLIFDLQLTDTLLYINICEHAVVVTTGVTCNVCLIYSTNFHLISTEQKSSVHITPLHAHTVYMDLHTDSDRRWKTTKNGRLHFIAASSLSALLLAVIKHSIIKGTIRAKDCSYR